VWVFIKHKEPLGSICLVVVHVPKHSLTGDINNCPAQDTKRVGMGRVRGRYAGHHVVTLKKGILNNPKNYVIKPPKSLKIPADNFDTWHVMRSID
jgi:hypothetical protein